MALRRLLLACLLLAAAATALGCAVPHDGCTTQICESYKDVTVDTVMFPKANYSDPATWLRGSLPLIGYYLGRYNLQVNNGSYNRAGIKGTPALNLERFDLETNKVNPATQAPYAHPSPAATLVDCCRECAKEDGCYLFQFFPPGTPSAYASSACYLLSGGTQTWDFPEHGTPFSGSIRHQTVGPRLSIPLSFVGGRCNGSADTVDDPHFTGARGTQFDFNGEIGKSFAILSDRGVHINGLFKGYLDARGEGQRPSATAEDKGLRTWIREVGFLWKDARGHTHRLHLAARDGAEQGKGAGFLSRLELDGVAVQEPTQPGVVCEQGDMRLEFVGTAKPQPKPKGRKKKGGAAPPMTVEADYYRLKIGDLMDLTISVRVERPMFQLRDEAETHFNLLLNKIVPSESIHGVLGQTFRTSLEQEVRALKYQELTRLLNAPIQADGKTGEGFLDGTPGDYVTSSVMASDCKFCTFQ